MEKVGIITWFKHNNYGTVLQAYALQEKIMSFGDEAKLINYSTRIKKTMIHEMKVNFIISKLSDKMLKRKYKNNYSKVNKKFNDFRNKYLNFTDECDNHIELKETSDLFDKIVCGSDQIWNPNFFDKHFFLDFVEDNSKKISYAPSIGVSTINKNEIKEKMSYYINRFSSISVREEQGRECIKEFCNKDIKVVLDPTLLLTKEEWIESLNINVDPKPYILCYFLGNNKEYVKIAKSLSKQLNLPIKVFPTTHLIATF